ncbi:MAG: glycosyltransferase family 87 protein [Planctomycetota bacterium]
MSGFWYYLIHLLGLVAGVLAVRALARAGKRAASTIVAVAVSVLTSTFLLTITDIHAVFEDFLEAYYPAGAAVRHGGGALAATMELGVFGFVNIPIVAWLFAPFSVLAPEPAAWAFTILGAAATLAAWWLLARLAGLRGTDSALLIFLFAASGPLSYSIKEANTSHIVLLMIVGAFALLRSGRDMRAGLLLGAAAVVKLPLLLFVVYFALRARWRALVGSVGAITAVGLLSLAMFGTELHTHWYQQCIEPVAKNPIAAFNVQSIPAALARLERGRASLRDWKPCVLNGRDRVLALAATAALYLAALAAAVWRRRPGAATLRMLPHETQLEIEFLLVLVLSLVAGTLSWSHYYVLLLMPIAFLLGRTAHFCYDAATRRVGWIAIVLALSPVICPQTSSWKLSQLYARVGVSPHLAGGLILLVLLVWARWTARTQNLR